MQLPEKLTYLRKQKGLTQSNLAETLNVSRQAISRWEVGTAVPSTDNLKVLSDLYDVSIDYLLNCNDIASSDDGDSQKQSVKEQSIHPKCKKGNRIFIMIAALLLGVIVGLLISTIVMSTRNQEQPVPIEEMDNVAEDNYSVETFSLGW